MSRLEDLRQLISEVHRQSAQPTVTRDSHLVHDLGLRSIELIALITKTERKFGIDLVSRLNMLTEVSTIGHVLDLIEQLQAESVAI